ncbi:MAG TPA: hypothetical protein VGA30_09885 [Actinomycetota bacterium]
MTKAPTAESERLEEQQEEAPVRVVRISVRSLSSFLPIAFVALVVAWRAWAALQWTFQGDDWAYASAAARIPFLRFVTMQYNGHLQVGQFALVWAVTKIAPLNYGVAVAPVLIATFLGGVLMWRLLRALFGDRPANFIPLAVFMLCPLSVPPALWWAASLQTILLQVFIVATLFVVLRYVRAPSTWRLVTAGLVYAGALLFWEKALLILPLVVLFVALFLGEGTGRARLRSVSVRRWHLWAVLAGISAPYTAWYVSTARWQLTDRATFSELVQLSKTAVGSTVIPTFLGGPWAASRGVLYQLASFPRLLTWAVAAAVVGVSLLFRRPAWRAWVLLGVYVGLDIALVASGRLGLIGPVIGLGARYFADSVPVFALALALAFMAPIERRNDPAWGGRVLVLDLGPQGRIKSLDLTSFGRSAARWGGSLMRRWLVIAVVLAYAVSAMITSSRMAGVAGTFSARQWFATVRSNLALHQDASIVDGYLPRVIPPALFPDAAKESRALAPIAPHVRWNAPAESMLIFDQDGRLRPAEVGRLASAEPGPVFGCGYLVNGEPVTAPLKHQLFSWTWGVKLSYLSNRPAPGFVTVDGDRQLVSFLPGRHTLTLVHAGTATAVTIEAGGSRVCVGDVVVGDLKPLAAGPA